eukprot:scaffold433_cov260-Chaetoceros_neogracile.AAC.68
MPNDDAVNEDELTLCCALCCVNCSTQSCFSSCGGSGKIGCCCLDIEVCLKAGAPCLPCCCCGPTCGECKGVNAQLQCCCVVCNAAVPCNSEVPVALVAGGLMIYPQCGCCVKQKEIMDR